jgi:transposase
MTLKDSSEVFVGLDVSKAYVDVCVINVAGEWLWNDRVVRAAAPLQQLAQRLEPQACVVMEATGGLEALPAAVLEAAGRQTSVENPAKIRHFALSHGWLEKTDQLDARVLAEFARERRPRPRRRPDPRVEALSKLVTRRSQLVRLRAAERTRLRGESDPFCRQSLGDLILTLSEQIEACEQQMRQRVEACPDLAARAKLLRSAPGVGEQTSYALLAWLPELGCFNRGQIAKLVGLAPLVKQSGLWRGRVMTLGGRARVRSALYLSALSAVRRHCYYRDFYLRLVARGKAKKLALIAVARKLLLTLNRMLASSSLWENSFDAA